MVRFSATKSITCFLERPIGMTFCMTFEGPQETTGVEFWGIPNKAASGGSLFMKVISRQVMRIRQFGLIGESAALS
jgi:hypothetical protein